MCKSSDKHKKASEQEALPVTALSWLHLKTDACHIVRVLAPLWELHYSAPKQELQAACNGRKYYCTCPQAAGLVRLLKSAVLMVLLMVLLACTLLYLPAF